ncbi:DUF5076 domain-containing protein [Brevundimonas sp.]|uniref:DUF5076 domain-containing protein n=1 Tax=Brevundimonas sp. TaxID=1871086 RepID=UPI002FCB7674
MGASDLEQRALPIPDNLNTGSDQVLELARIWWNENGASMNIRPALREPAHMGTVLAELAWHFSNAYTEHHGLDQAAAFADILKGWEEAHAKASANLPEGGQ